MRGREGERRMRDWQPPIFEPRALAGAARGTTPSHTQSAKPPGFIDCYVDVQVAQSTATRSLIFSMRLGLTTERPPACGDVSKDSRREVSGTRYQTSATKGGKKEKKVLRGRPPMEEEETSVK
ncbi:hypothetical protein MTO96_008280 [Rhipicephalus appendiculatus]